MKPIIFSTPMVQAINAGRKTQTRCLIKFPKGLTGSHQVGEANNTENPIGLMWPCGIKRPPYQINDILWVRETWAHGEYSQYEKIVYRADDANPKSTPGLGNWKPSIHMPREAARIFLRVTDVRVERVQDISPSDCLDEGIINGICHACLSEERECRPQRGENIICGGKEKIIGEYAVLWDKLNAKHGYGWDINPWVWVITFERIRQLESRSSI